MVYKYYYTIQMLETHYKRAFQQKIFYDKSTNSAAFCAL